MGKYIFSSKNKDRRKQIRSILQGILLIGAIYIIILALFSSKTYGPFKETERNQTENGFIAVSYFGVDRIGNETLISKENLERHIKALKESGYVTITQEDIKDYYANKKELPEKSLFLMFEDGRRDTAIFTQEILEKYNYKASILSYGQNLTSRSPKFLSPSDLKSLQKNSFWELGTNGYRLSYINALDRHGNFLGELSTEEYQIVRSYLDRNYNHYLMDYKRDEYGIPTETYEEMAVRISHDYTMIAEGYMQAIQQVPQMYVLMHSNTGRFGTNNKVSAVNEEHIYNLFKMNFNREGYSRNTLDASIYDLTRIQPQAYWSTNHLLMCIWEDTKQEVAFVSGNLDEKKHWDTRLGASEFIEDRIILTTLPRGKGWMVLKDSEGYKDIAISTLLKGNKIGSQRIYMRSNEDLTQYIAVEIKDNILTVSEKQNLDKKELFVLDLDLHDGLVPQSMEENKLESEIKYLEAKIKYALDVAEAKELNRQLKEKRMAQVQTISEGAEKYIPRTDILEGASRRIHIQLKDHNLSLKIDGKAVFRNLEVSILGPGSVGLEASFENQGYSQRNLWDSVYDGVFEEIVIEDISQEEELSEVLYSNRLMGFEKYKYVLKSIWERVINWFIQYL